MASYRSTFEENFRAVKEPAQNKKGYVIRYVYIGKWHIWRADRAAVRRTKQFCAIVFVLSLAIYLLGALADSPLTYSRLVALPGTMALAAMLVEGFGVCQFCLAKDRLTCQDFQDVNTKLTLGAFFHAALLLWAALAAAAQLIGTTAAPADVLVPLGFLASAVLAGGLLFVYRALPQGVMENEDA
ncbi:MAG: hypothetical protein ACI4PG_04835 [Candidatus Ventricola sp.]